MNERRLLFRMDRRPVILRAVKSGPSHHSPKRKRGARRSPSLTLRASAEASRAQYREFPARPRSLDHPTGRPGFTLVELLIAVALTVLIMSMFVQVFQLASASITRQKGIANLDQSERTLTTILRADIAHRTFRDVVPFKPGQSTTGTPPAGPRYASEKRRGYFSISNNNPDDNTDDVLQLTIETINSNNPADATDREKSVLFGRATLLKDPASGLTNFQYLAANPNQPEFDDGRFTINSIGSSKAAEVSYFLRNGILYRRVLLIRETYDYGGPITDQPNELTAPAIVNPNPPNTNPNLDYTISVAPNGSGEFWRDFDYSAFRLISSATGLPNGPPNFHSLASLSNSSVPALAGETYPRSLGIPHLRFGYDVLNGLPREFVGTSFIGRFTVQETAHSAFDYPGRLPSAGTIPNGGNPFAGVTPLTYNNATGLVQEYEGETFRRGEDILLTNVHEFDVKVWDGAYQETDTNGDGIVDPGEDTNHNGRFDFNGGFVDVGHNSTTGDYRNGAPTAASTALPVAGFYDTWHPDSNMPAVPYRPVNSPGANGTPEPDLLGADDEVPLKAIQITIRFFDTTSNRMRQLTLVLSLTDGG